MDKDLSKQLQPLREEIDTIDKQVLELLNRRANVALKVGQVKTSFDTNDSIIKPEREASIIRHLQDTNSGPYQVSAVEAVWREVISACRGLEKVPVVAY